MYKPAPSAFQNSNLMCVLVCVCERKHMLTVLVPACILYLKYPYDRYTFGLLISGFLSSLPTQRALRHVWPQQHKTPEELTATARGTVTLFFILVQQCFFCTKPQEENYQLLLKNESTTITWHVSPQNNNSKWRMSLSVYKNKKQCRGSAGMMWKLKCTAVIET